METPKCKECGEYMFEIGTTGRIISQSADEKCVGSAEIKLYQCSEDKTITLK